MQYQTNYRIAHLLNYSKILIFLVIIRSYYMNFCSPILWINMDILQINWKYFLFQSLLARQELVTGCPIYNIMLVDYPFFLFFFFQINMCFSLHLGFALTIIITWIWQTIFWQVVVLHNNLLVPTPNPWVKLITVLVVQLKKHNHMHVCIYIYAAAKPDIIAYSSIN